MTHPVVLATTITDTATVARLRHPDAPDLTLELTLDQAGHLVGLGITATNSEITARRLRSIPIGQLRDVAFSQSQRERDPAAEIFGEVGWDDRGLAAIAAEYVDLVRAGRPAATILADRYSYELGTVRNLLHRARTHELLTEAPRGRQGGDLTPKALDLLATRLATPRR